MIFKRRQKSSKELKDPIVWRGHEVTRIEAFSDAVFGFAVTLMIVSLEVPKNYEEFIENMKGFFPFAISFLIFFQIWTAQNLFFRRFGLHDDFTLTLNAALLFTVLFFVYPLKFLWSGLLLHNVIMKEEIQGIHLFYIYGGGFAIIYFLFAAMYWHANRRRAHLNLTDSEAFETMTYSYRHLFMGCVGVISMIVASFGGAFLALAGMSYSLCGVAVSMVHRRRGKIHRKKFEQVAVLVTETENEPEGERIEAD